MKQKSIRHWADNTLLGLISATLSESTLARVIGCTSSVEPWSLIWENYRRNLLQIFSLTRYNSMFFIVALVLLLSTFRKPSLFLKHWLLLENISPPKNQLPLCLMALVMVLTCLSLRLGTTTSCHSSLPCVFASWATKLGARSYLLLNLNHLWHLRLLSPYLPLSRIIFEPKVVRVFGAVIIYDSHGYNYSCNNNLGISDSASSQLQCQLCNGFDHSARNRLWLSSFGQLTVPSSLNIAFVGPQIAPLQLNLPASSQSHDDGWYIDTSASTYMTGDNALLHDHIPYSGLNTVQLGNGENLPITIIDNPTLPHNSSSFSSL